MDPEKAMAIHSSTLAWKIPWTEEPGRLQSTGSHRVGHNWSDLAAAAVFWILTSCQMYGLQILSPIGCLFTLLIASLAVQKLFRLMQSHLLLFAFVFLLLRSYPRNHHQNQCEGDFSLWHLLQFLWFQVLCLSH